MCVRDIKVIFRVYYQHGYFDFLRRTFNDQARTVVGEKLTVMIDNVSNLC